MSDQSQSLLRVIMLAAMTAGFAAVWNGDAAQTKGMSLAQRNRVVFPAHGLAGSQQPTTQPIAMARTTRPMTRRMIAEPARTIAASKPAVATTANDLPAGTYRVVHMDGRVEWLTVIDRSNSSPVSAPAVIATSLGGQPVHLIRVTEQAATESTRH
jgi:hypothetical protein